MKVDIVTGSGRAACLKCDRVIPKGEPCIEIRHGSGAHSAVRKVCRDCIQKMRDELFYFSDYSQGNRDIKGDKNDNTV